MVKWTPLNLTRDFSFEFVHEGFDYFGDHIILPRFSIDLQRIFKSRGDTLFWDKLTNFSQYNLTTFPYSNCQLRMSSVISKKDDPFDYNYNLDRVLKSKMKMILNRQSTYIGSICYHFLKLNQISCNYYSKMKETPKKLPLSSK